MINGGLSPHLSSGWYLWSHDSKPCLLRAIYLFAMAAPGIEGNCPSSMITGNNESCLIFIKRIRLQVLPKVGQHGVGFICLLQICLVVALMCQIIRLIETK